MADVKKIRLPNGTDLTIKDSRITGVDNAPTSGSGNVVTSGGVYTAIEDLDAKFVQATPVGTFDPPEIAPYEYATRDQVDALEQKVDDLSFGKCYGFFDTAQDLPEEAEDIGFAYVGTDEPFAIFQFDGTDWTDSGSMITGLAARPQDVQDAVDDYLDEHPTISGTFLNTAKQKLVQLLEKVAFVDGNGQSYIDELVAYLFLSPIDHISVVYTQGDTVIYDIYKLSSLNANLVVTVFYKDGTSARTTDYTLSGTIAAGTSTITATVEDAVTSNIFTGTFNVTVTETTKLYMDGDECSTLTGGWQNVGFDLTNGTPTASKESTYMFIKFAKSGSGSAAKTFSTVNQIDLTGKTKIIVEFEAFNDSGRCNFFAYFPSTLAESTTQAGAFGDDYGDNRSSLRSLPQEGSTYNGTRAVTMSTNRTTAYISLNYNGYSYDGSVYSAGAYLKIKKVALA